MVELGIILSFQGNFEDSIRILKKALRIRKYQLAKIEKGGGDENHTKKQIVNITNRIGCVYFTWGKNHTAKEVFKATVELQRDILDESEYKSPAPEMLILASTLSNIGKLRNQWYSKYSTCSRSFNNRKFEFI